MKQKNFQKDPFSVELLVKKMTQMKKAFMKRNAEIRKIMRSEFNLGRVLSAQREFEMRVLEFQGMIESLYSCVKVEPVDEKGKKSEA